MGKPVKPKPFKARRSKGRKWIVLVVLLVLAALVYFGAPPVLRMAGNYLVVNETPGKADAIVVLGGGDPARPLEGARLYREGKAPYVVVSVEQPPLVYEQLKKDGVVLFLPYENYLRVLKGYGVPDDHLLTLEEPVNDTLGELENVAHFAAEQSWKNVIVVTSGYHTRRAKLVSRYLMEPDIHVTVVACPMDSFSPDSWWKTQGDIRTFAIEVEKLVSYSLYLWPRLIWRNL